MDKASNGYPSFIASNKIHNGDIPNGNGHCLNGFKSGASFAHHLRKMAQKYGDGSTTLDNKLNQLRACIGVSTPREELMKIATYQSNQIKSYNLDSSLCNGQNFYPANNQPGSGCKAMIAERKDELKSLMTQLDALNAELHSMRQRKNLGTTQDPDHKFLDSEKQIEHLKEIYKAKSALSSEQNAKITHHQRFLFDLQHDLSSIIKQLEITSRQLYQHDEKLVDSSQATSTIAFPLPINTAAHCPAITSPATKLQYADIIRSSPQKSSVCSPSLSYPNYYTTNNFTGTRITPSTLPLGTAIPWHPPKPVFNSLEIDKEPAAQHIYARIGRGPSPIGSNNHTPHEQRLNIFGSTYVTIPRPSISVQFTNTVASLDNFNCGLQQNGNFQGALSVAKSEKFHCNPHSLKSLRRRHSYAEPLQDPLTLESAIQGVKDEDRLAPEMGSPYEVRSNINKDINMAKIENSCEISKSKDENIISVHCHHSNSYQNNVTISSTQLANPPDPLSLNKPSENELEFCNAGAGSGGSSGEESWQTVTTTTNTPTAHALASIPKSLRNSEGAHDYFSTDSGGPGRNDNSDLDDFNSATIDQVKVSCPREFYNDMDSFEGDKDETFDEVCQLSPRPNTYGQNAIEQYWEESAQPSPDLKSCLKKRRSEGEKERKVQFDPLALLLDAALEGELDLVIQSAKKAPDPSASNDEGITALHNAICAGHYDIVKFLVDFGCDINAQDSDGWTPLHCAASCNNFEMIKYLVENGAAVFATTVSDNETALEKCEEDEYDYHRCASYLYRIQESTGLANEGQVFALYDFQAKELDELTFSMGETLVVTDRDGDQNWWLASNLSRQSGLVPKNYIGLYKRILWKPSKDE